MSFKNKRDLWYVSGNKDRGDIYAIPATEIGEKFKQHTNEIVQLANSELDGARRWVVVAPSGEAAVKKLVAFCKDGRR
ncbi:MAG: hypothetical protein DRJ03_13120 [Chloroflexi bacterium]|nr:MAG: hypothetical protein DRJ03_13120 [Chloroflexota bacterium]